MTKTLKTIHADIAWLVAPWDEVDVSDGPHGKYIQCVKAKVLLPDDENVKVLTNNPTQSNENFWREVIDWHFALEHRKFDKVMGYYRLYGPLDVIPAPAEAESNDFDDKEYLEHIKAALGWFSCLVSMTEWLKSDPPKTGPLWDLFGKPRNLEKLFVKLYDPDFRPIGGGSCAPFYCIQVMATPMFTESDEDFAFSWSTPQNDVELLQATWNAIVIEVQKFMNGIQLAAVSIGEFGKPNLSWCFNASGALQAAFLQWYFQELAHIDLSFCAKKGCEHLARSTSKYCSKKCEVTAAKQRQRERRITAIRLYKTEEWEPKDIVVNIYPAEERERLKSMGKSPEKIVRGWLGLP